jgi:hypothetical protein
MAAADLRELTFIFCRKYGVPLRDKPGMAPEPELRAILLGIAEAMVHALIGAFGRTDSLDMVMGELRELIQIDKLDQFDMVAVVTALGQIDQAVEVLRLMLGVDGAPVAAEIHRAAMRKVKLSKVRMATPDDWEPPDVATELGKQGYRP